jgi:Family of unknown function (DUF6491)
MRFILSLAAVGLLGTAVYAASPAQEARATKEAAALEKAIAGKVAGKPVSCISLRDIDRSQIIGENAIIYRISTNRFYVNKPRGGCPNLRDGRALITRIPTDRLCSGDIARVVDLTLGFEGAACTLGDFTPYTKARS